MKKLLTLSLLVSFFTCSKAQTPYFTTNDYKKALWMTTRMYGGQRSGTSAGAYNWLLIDKSTNGNSFVKDKDTDGYDLSGGWFDCGDHPKFGQTEFYSAYVLLKGYAEFAGGYDDRYAYNYAGYKNAGNWTFEGSGHAANGTADIVDEVRHATDYFIKCTRDASTFYYQVGNGAYDHKHWVTSVQMQTRAVTEGGEGTTQRNVFKNPADAPMASFAGATLALMARILKTSDPTYAQTCIDHAKFAYAYANAHKGQSAKDAEGGAYYGSLNANPSDAYVCLLAELYWATNDATYQTEALAYTVGATSGNIHGMSWGLDYVNNGDLGVYNLYLLGKTGAAAAFTTIINNNYLTKVQSDGQFSGGNTGYGPLRYNGNTALIVAFWLKRNPSAAAATITSAKKFVYSNIDYILGKNSKNLSFIVGFTTSGITSAIHPHHRNVYLSDADALTANMAIPARNTQFGYMVGGRRDPTAYLDDATNYNNTEGGIDYNAGLVGALAYINLVNAPVNKFTVADVMAVVTGINNTEESKDLIIFPNPSNSQFTLNSPENGIVKVFDNIGKEIMTFSHEGECTFGETLIPGIYHVVQYKDGQIFKSVNIVK